jgi:hypothetical protein
VRPLASRARARRTCSGTIAAVHVPRSANTHARPPHSANSPCACMAKRACVCVYVYVYVYVRVYVCGVCGACRGTCVCCATHPQGGGLLDT